MSTRNFFVLAMLSVALLAGCADEDPIRVGFIGGLSDRNSDVGLSGHRGVVLAVEQLNRAGGVDGRQIELIALDDAQDRQTAEAAARELVAAGVEAVIGPFMSSMAAAVAPVFNEAGIVVISPTITSMDFYGRDDYLIRINRTTRDNAREYAEALWARGQRRIAIALDVRNRTFTASWLAEFRAALGEHGGEVVAAVEYTSEMDTDFEAVVREMLARPSDGLFFISGAVDVARLAQQARKLAPTLPIGAAEWAGTEQLVKLGGDVIDGLLIVQNFNRDDRSPRYAEFRDAYFNRFQHAPGYSSVMANDAATVLFHAMRTRGAKQSLKEALLGHGPYPGLQEEIVFDSNGDTQRKVYFAEVHDGDFKLVK
ncbi:MAG: ABC transporter substrate-binding protein [Gammaproteobacteria bacterium]|nr:ABC transporter substrate-binding protein [Gammaproteobacteria bacterium]